METKIMHFANFNITFGEKEEPMLLHFEDVIFPAFTGNYKRGKEEGYPKLGFSDVEIKQTKDEDYVLVGNYIKDTQYNIRTTIQNGELTSSPARVPTAPYSRFIIFLKNHRMILVRNESSSPDIRSFQATVRDILNKYIREKNKGIKKADKLSQLPFAIVNIVDIPLKEDIESILKAVHKINWIQLQFFPLNNDLNPLPIAQAINDEMGRVGSRTANAKFNSPDSKQGVKKMLEDTAGLARTTMSITDEEGETKKIKEESFSSNKIIPFSRDINSSDDEHLITIAKQDAVISITSPDNLTLYERFVGIIGRLMI